MDLSAKIGHVHCFNMIKIMCGSFIFNVQNAEPIGPREINNITHGISDFKINLDT